ncbi:stage II sporulation protein M [Methanococcoides sp. FTZ1]|uniref:stage II sporulation protein M n=1 Tax=Methanococcoides sp. FTZ1 TaxID=3439061 RepID=UPI003F85976A
MINEESSRFKIKRKDVIWSVKLFILFAVLAFASSISVYMVAFIFSGPEATSNMLISTAQAATSEIDVVNDVIISTSEAATSKVDFGARYIGPLYSVFFFNIVAIFVTSIGAGVITYSHRIVFREIIFRSKHPLYLRMISSLDRPSPIFLSFIRKVAARVYPELKQHENTEKNKNPDSIWKNCNYTGEDYRSVASLLPLIFPVLTLLLNGIIAGLVLAFFLFNGVLWGNQAAGFPGILVGVDFAFIYYLASLLPHGIIELPAIFIATSLAYRFARVHSEEIIEGHLFEDEVEEDDIKKDIQRIENITGAYLRAGYTLKMISFTILMLLIAAYIEIQLTPRISGYVIGLMSLLNSNILI